MARIDQVIFAVDLVDVHVVVVVPVTRPRFGVSEIVAAVVEAAIVAALYVKMVRAAEAGTKLLFGNAAAVTAIIGVVVVAMLFGLLRALLFLSAVLLSGALLIAIVLFLLLLLGAIVLLRRLGVRTAFGFLFWFFLWFVLLALGGVARLCEVLRAFAVLPWAYLCPVPAHRLLSQPRAERTWCREQASLMPPHFKNLNSGPTNLRLIRFWLVLARTFPFYHLRA